MELLRYSIIIAAAGLLLASLLPMRRLLVGLPRGQMQRGWQWLSALVLTMIGAELLYAMKPAFEIPLPQELMMPIALLAGSWFVMLISQLSAGSIKDAHRLIELEAESVTDSLTGLFNRRHLNDRLKEEIERARRQASPLSLMLIDADHFKQINDRHGHQIGDQALVHLAQIIRQESRNCDIVVRYGGEEILVMSPGANQTQARLQAERIRRRVAEQPLLLRSGEKLPLAVSIGVGQLGLQDSWDAQAFVARIDDALYRAKRQGRNRVEVAPVASPSDRVAHLRDWIARQRENQAA